MGRLAKMQEDANREYYTRKGGRIYSDFITYANSDGKIAECNAIEFCKKFGKKKNKRVLEIGVGNGNFAAEFLKKANAVAPGMKIDYTLADISEKMLFAAEKRLQKGGFAAKTIHSDATKVEFAHSSFDYVRLQELLTDLPSSIFVLCEGRVFEVAYGKDGGASGLCFVDEKTSAFVEPVLSRLGENYFVPFNFAACELVVKLYDAIAPGGYVDIFDYGFANADDLLPYDMWNQSIVREYGGQLTVDLNIPLLLSFAKSAGFEADVQLQKEYVERVLGEKVMGVQKKNGLHYMTKKELGKEGGKKENLLDNYEEDDGFYHVRLAKKGL
jgi:SAM-dependent MidA family methyltransferase